MSVDKLASEVGVVRQQIVRLEAGLGGTTLPRLVAIATVLGVSIEDIVSSLSPDRTQDNPGAMAFRGHGLTPEEMKQVLDYIEFLEHRREKR